MGGLIPVLGFLVGALFQGVDWHAWFLVLGFLLIGFVDDFVVPRLIPGKRGLGWKQKLLLETVVAIAACVQGGPILPIAGSIFCVLVYSNAYNFADGLDGLAGLIGSLVLIGLALMNALMGNEVAAIGCWIFVGSLVPFQLVNAPPAKVFMGDTGSLAIGAFIGLIYFRTGAVSHAGPSTWVALVLLSLVLFAELLPVPIQIFWVKVFKRKLFPFTPIHHSFEKAGWKETRVVGLFCIVQFVLLLGALSVFTMFPEGMR